MDEKTKQRLFKAIEQMAEHESIDLRNARFAYQDSVTGKLHKADYMDKIACRRPVKEVTAYPILVFGRRGNEQCLRLYDDLA